MELRQRRLILWIGAGIIVLWCGILLAGFVFLPALQQVMEARAVQMLRGQFASEVRFQYFEVSFSPRAHVVVRGVSIGNDSAHPLIQAASADASCGWLPWHIRTLVLDGLSVQIPTVGSAAVAARKPALTVSIDEITSEHAHVEILPSLHFELAHVRVENFNANHAAGFSAIVVNPQPRADIQASGRLGPWNADDPSRTTLQGTFSISHCDLATLPGWKGILTSQGRFQGVLRRIQISGEASASQFSLSASGHPEPLHASFQATVDASDGSASVDQINGVLQSSSFSASGVVHNVQDDRRREIALDISMPQGRLEDVVPMAVKSNVSPVTGALRLKGKLEILPGDQDVVNRLRLDADFAAPDARFSSRDLRERLRSASRKAQGHPNNDAAGSSIANIQGHVQLNPLGPNSGVAEFSSLAFDLEGASARLTGLYQMATERLDLHGEVWLDATPSQTATGVKAFFLKAAQPFFRSKRGGSRVPIKITGTRSDPQFALNVVK